jgi:hypothetical protein
MRVAMLIAICWLTMSFILPLVERYLSNLTPVEMENGR